MVGTGGTVGTGPGVGVGVGDGVGVGFGFGLPPDPGTLLAGGWGGGEGSARVTGGACEGGAARRRSPAALTISAQIRACCAGVGR